MRHLASAAGPLRSKASPPESKQESSLGEIPKMGEPQFPLFGRFKGWGVGAGEIEIPRPDPFFPAAFFGKKAVPPEARLLGLQNKKRAV